jgi:hypothetical protein
MENENLTGLRAVTAPACDVRMKKDGEFGTAEVAQWLVRHKRTTVIEGLADLVCQAMDRWNDDDRVERVLRAKPDLEPLVPVMRQVSETLVVPPWYLLDKLDDQQPKRALAVAEAISYPKTTTRRVLEDLSSHRLVQRYTREEVERIESLASAIRGALAVFRGSC